MFVGVLSFDCSLRSHFWLLVSELWQQNSLDAATATGGEWMRFTGWWTLSPKADGLFFLVCSFLLAPLCTSCFRDCCSWLLKGCWDNYGNSCKVSRNPLKVALLKLHFAAFILQMDYFIFTETEKWLKCYCRLGGLFKADLRRSETLAVYIYRRCRSGRVERNPWALTGWSHPKQEIKSERKDKENDVWQQITLSSCSQNVTTGLLIWSCWIVSVWIRYYYISNSVVEFSSLLMIINLWISLSQILPNSSPSCCVMFARAFLLHEVSRIT